MGRRVAADCAVSVTKGMIGVDGNKDVRTNKALCSGFMVAYPMPDKPGDSTAGAIRHLKGDLLIERLH